MTKEEYLSNTELQNISEAQHYLVHTKQWFIAILVSSLFLPYLADNINSILKTLAPSLFLESNGFVAVLTAAISILHLFLFVFFLFFCHKIIKLTRRVTRAQLVFAWFLAPFSWVWFYPDLIKPLRIIVGELPPPDHVPTQSEMKEYSKQFWKPVKVQVTVFLLFLLIALAALVTLK